MERLDKFAASQTSLSRSQVRKAVKDGRLRLNGKICKSADIKLDPENDEITLDGARIVYRKHLYIMMNKPGGVLSASNDKKARTVIDLLPDNLRREGLFPAGRLDKDTTGLLIITDDGDFAHNILSPKKHVYKIYKANLSGEVTDETVAAFEKGIVFSDGTKCLPAQLWCEENEPKSTAYVKIREGKFHQVKKMFLVCGLSVTALKRIQIGKLLLDANLAEGEARELNFCELSLIQDGD